MRIHKYKTKTEGNLFLSNVIDAARTRILADYVYITDATNARFIYSY